MGYRHGIYTSEIPTSITPPVNVSAGLIVAFGTSPVNQLDNPSSAVNKPVIAYTYAEAVSKIGFSTNFEKYTLSEVIKVAFGIYGVAPVVFINVLDPTKHKADVVDEAVKLSGGKATLAKDGVLYDSVVVKVLRPMRPFLLLIPTIFLLLMTMGIRSLPQSLVGLSRIKMQR